jgi:hypothetical protein
MDRGQIQSACCFQYETQTKGEKRERGGNASTTASSGMEDRASTREEDVLVQGVSMVVKGREVRGECVERARGTWKRQGRGKTAIADGRQRFKRAQAEPSGVRTSQTTSQPASQARSIGSVKRGGGSAGIDDGLPCLVPSSLPASSDLPRTRKLARSLSRASPTTHSS